jgi:putative hydrolase of the HAD superfamily
MNAPQAVLFDLEGTLLREIRFDPESGTARLLALAENPNGVSLRDARAMEASLLADLLPRKESSLLELPWRAFHKLLTERLGLRFDRSPEDLELEFWDATETMEVMPGLPAALDALSARAIPLGVISNSRCGEATLAHELRKHGLESRFRFLMSSSDYGVRKPHPFLFLTAAAKLSVDPHEVWFVGDSRTADIAGSQAAGMTGIRFNPLAKPAADPLPDVEIRSWDEFLRLLR